MDRISRDQMLMEIAYVMAKRSTCSRLHVGAVISFYSRIVSTGYNGNLSGAQHCTHTEADGDTPCTSTIHAELNAILWAARKGSIPLARTTMYVTASPCYRCAQAIVNTGITEVCYDKPFRDPLGLDVLEASGIKVRQVSL